MVIADIIREELKSYPETGETFVDTETIVDSWAVLTWLSRKTVRFPCLFVSLGLFDTG